MARKTSDIAMLLGSRSKSRSRGGIGKKFTGFVDSLLGKTSRGRSRSSHGQAVSVWVLAIAVLVAFGGGFVVGGKLGGGESGDDPLRTEGQQPTFFNEVEVSPLTGSAFVVAVYSDLGDEDGFAQARALSTFLRDNGLERTRPYRWPTNAGDTVWVTAVYFDGQSEEQAVRGLLQTLAPRTTDAWFQGVKNGSGDDWPVAMKVPMQ